MWISLGKRIMMQHSPASMQGFWRRTKPWRPSKEPRERPKEQGQALEWTFKGNLDEVVSVHCIFMEKDDTSPPKPTHLQRHNSLPPSATNRPNKMKLAFLLNDAEPATAARRSEQETVPMKPANTTPSMTCSQLGKRQRQSL